MTMSSKSQGSREDIWSYSTPEIEPVKFNASFFFLLSSKTVQAKIIENKLLEYILNVS